MKVKKLRKLTLLDLVNYYIYKNFDEFPQEDFYKSMITDIWSLLNNGWTSEEIYNIIKNTSLSSPIKDIFNKRKKITQNLLKPNIFYYHNNLRLTPMPKVYLDENDQIMQDDEKYYLEMIASYTIDEVVDYYIYKLKLPNEFTDINRIKGAMNHLIKLHGIDLTLYMIDAYYIELQDGSKQFSSNPLVINDVIDQARNTLNSKKNESKSMGDDKIVPKERKIDFGNRGTSTKQFY